MSVYLTTQRQHFNSSQFPRN